MSDRSDSKSRSEASFFRHRIPARIERARRLLSPRVDDEDRPGALQAAFGPLELEVLESLWQRDEATSVRDLQRSFDDTAYTTLMTTLDRLYKKGVLDRHKRGRAYVYTPRFSRGELQSLLARDTFEALLGAEGARASLRPLISCFVDAVSERDTALLDDLEKLVREKRRARRRSAAASMSDDDSAGGGSTAE